MGQKTVLVVEDEPAVRAMLSLVLETRDYRVVRAEDGQQALVMVQTEWPDAILLDLMLPNVDGFSVIEALYHDARSARIPIIVMSAGHRLEMMGRRGVRAFLSKPFDIDGLMRALEDALTSAPPADAPQSREHDVAPPPLDPVGELFGPPYAGPTLH
jgi:two-component system, OmpR family, phosphate regulon response regulator PhoB